MTSERDACGIPEMRSKPGTAADASAMSAIATISARHRPRFMHISGPLWKTTNDA
jgi:hypothetical protein